ncbi:MAG: cell wall metabolism sensor histidine kinase WalK [Anaerohalosphaeraceae bacterium]|nr:cell wall metabolism sensor histidine kinase WalK [Anaerohalosphaeraceae bacterium]
MNTENIVTNLPNENENLRVIRELIERKSKNLEAIFDAVPIGMLLLDENLIVRRVNNAIRKMVGKSYTDILDKPIGDALRCRTITVQKGRCGISKQCSFCHLRKEIELSIETSMPILEFEFKSKIKFAHRSELPWFSLSIEPVTIDGKKEAVVCLNDITERKIAQEKMVEAIEMKSQFTSTVSHELRTPLTAIGEGLNIVLEGVTGKLKKKQRYFLELAKRNVDRLGLLINDILDFQKIESGKMTFEFLSDNMTDTAREVYEMMALAAKKGNLNFVLDTEKEDIIAEFDRNRMIQVLTNLLSNAIKFTPAKGTVTFRVFRNDSDLVIKVSDTGMGIPEDDLKKVFDRFYRVNRPGKEINGTGLGLPIVEQVVSRHHGKVIAESEVGKGTTFTITMPVAMPKNSSRADELLEETVSKS